MPDYRILHIEDAEDDRILVAERLNAGLERPPLIRYAEDEAGVRAVLAAESVDLVLCDHDLPGFSAMRAHEVVRESGRWLPFVILSGVLPEQRGVQEMIRGVTDFVSKNRLDRLVPVVRRELDALAQQRFDQRRQRDTEDRLHLVSQAVEASGDAILVTDRNTTPIYANRAFHELLSLGGERFGLELIFGRDLDALSHQVLASGSPWQEERRLHDPAGRERICDVRVDAVRDVEGRVAGMVAVIRDRTSQHQLQDRLDYLSRRDPITGLLNRRQFEESLQRKASQRPQAVGSDTVALLDLDRFRVINNTCGHDVGDVLLGEVAALLRQELQEQDLVARISADRFALLLRERLPDAAVEVVRAIMRRLRDFRFRWDGEVFDCTACAGIAPVNSPEQLRGDAFARADEALRQAKEKGRHKLQLFLDDDRDLIARLNEMQWVSRIRQALDADWFYLCGQPICPLGTDDGVAHLEVLVRMRDGDGRHWNPGEFIPAAEHFGLMAAVDRWVLESAFALLARGEGVMGDPRARLSINLSAQSLSDCSLLAWLEQRLALGHIDPDRLVFEITETAAIADFEGALRFVETLRGLGCRFALDDFGSGLSSFAYLKRLHVDYLKIDGSFIRDIERSDIDRALVESMHRMGRQLGIRTVAEFVDSEAKLQLLQSMGVDYAQGFLFGRPQPLTPIDPDVARCASAS